MWSPDPVLVDFFKSMLQTLEEQAPKLLPGESHESKLSDSLILNNSMSNFALGI